MLALFAVACLTEEGFSNGDYDYPSFYVLSVGFSVFISFPSSVLTYELALDYIFLFFEEDSSVFDSSCSFSSCCVDDPLVNVRLLAGAEGSGGLSRKGDLRLRSFLYSFTTFSRAILDF